MKREPDKLDQAKYLETVYLGNALWIFAKIL